MSRRISVCAGALLVLFELTTSTVVLPRPPSSLNHIHQEQELAMRKALEGKSLHGVPKNNMNRPDTEDYRLLEIELHSADEMDAANLQGLVHAMLKQQQLEQTPSDSYPNPEVIPHSILGVRDMGGPSPHYRLDTFDNDKHVLLSPPKLHSLDEKLYYLKTSRPKVYVNVRGRSGSFHKGEAASTSTVTPSEGPVGFLRRMTRPPFERQIDRKIRDKKTQPPKKFDRRIDGGIVMRNEEMDQGTDDDPSTTENSMVTSSELPKQIPAPPSKVLGRALMAQTTPVQRYALRRTDILPGYGFADE